MGRFVAPFAALIFGCALDFVLSEAIRPRDANDTEGYPHGTLSRPREPTQMADPLEEPYWLPLAYEVQLAHLSRPPLVVPGDDIDRECAPARENFYARLILSKSQIPNEKRTFEVRDFDYVSKSFQRTALTAACRLQYDAEGFVLHLLSRGADIDFARPSDHKTALIQAVRSHNAPLLDLLLTTDKLSKAVQLHLEEYPLPDGYPKVPPVREADVNLADGDGNTALIHAAAAGVLEAGTALLDKDTRPGHLNLAGDSALHVAVKENKHLFVRMMMKRVEPKKHVNSLGETLGPDGEALDHPTVSSSSSSVKNRELLKDAGGKFIIDPNIKNADGFTPLMVAAQKGRVLPAVELLHRCNGNEKYPSGLRSALMEALAHRSHGVALALLNWQLRPGMGLKSMPGVFSNAKSPYFLGKKAPSTTMGAQAEADSDATAADFEDSIMASMDNSVDLNIQDKDGETALVYAVQSGDVDVLRALLKMGADPNMHDNVSE
uniref:Uncharacterized protein n=1 Tax=Chromera velia CCMP2878 TaxID=1169474 RepID=A0A0G4I402_9ALVE|eukprot:Cvel_10798.t1-p1 / transcript=Cvel_10798.t1 / gene=Cvel_10798 / organism=Chromera_velia_CCMP2878 / gene_product=hypothetical protein / transcript_product=hypothetical protein / location=Cvel_scaffold660:47209-52070(+) / protein_length=491 / sequence_SO=supercontig / SO=protein_coding / is_pseudo=false